MKKNYQIIILIISYVRREQHYNLERRYHAKNVKKMAYVLEDIQETFLKR